MGTSGLSTLAGHVDGLRPVPVGGVEDLAIARARYLFEVRVERRGVHRGSVAWARQGSQVEQRLGAGRLVERMAKAHLVKLAPWPGGGVRARELGKPIHRRREGVDQQAIARRRGLRAEGFGIGREEMPITTGKGQFLAKSFRAISGAIRSKTALSTSGSQNS